MREQPGLDRDTVGEQPVRGAVELRGVGADAQARRDRFVGDQPQLPAELLLELGPQRPLLVLGPAGRVADLPIAVPGKTLARLVEQHPHPAPAGVRGVPARPHRAAQRFPSLVEHPQHGLVVALARPRLDLRACLLDPRAPARPLFLDRLVHPLTRLAESPALDVPRLGPCFLEDLPAALLAALVEQLEQRLEPPVGPLRGRAHSFTSS